MMTDPMKTTVSEESPTKVRLTIEAGPEDLTTAVEHAFKALAKETKIPGFRPGKAPRAILEARLDKETIREAIIKEAVPHLYVDAVNEQGFKPITNPEIDVKEFDETTGITFDALFEVKPKIELPTIDGIVVRRPSADATDEEVSEQLKRLVERFATLEPVTRNGRRGDFALIDIRGYWNDEEIESATATDMLYEIGSGGIVPELDQEIDGRRAGEILKFNAVLPPHFGETWGGREVSFQALVKEIRQKVLPSLDDDFAKTASEFDTLDELRADLRDKIAKIKAAAADAEVKNRALEQILDTTALVPPDAMVEEELAYRLRRFMDGLRGAGVTLDQYIEQTGAAEEQIESDMRREAERSIAAQLILDEIGRANDIQVTDEELEEELARHTAESGKTAADLRKQLASTGRLGVLAGDIIRRKALDLIVEKADIKDEDASG
jgi:trigger factor